MTSFTAFLVRMFIKNSLIRLFTQAPDFIHRNDYLHKANSEENIKIKEIRYSLMEESRFKSLDDIVRFTIEKVLETIKKDFILVPKEEWGTYDRRIMDALRKFDKPVSLEFLAHECGIEKPRLCKKLRLLEKYGKVRCVTKKISSYWKVND